MGCNYRVVTAQGVYLGPTRSGREAISAGLELAMSDDGGRGWVIVERRFPWGSRWREIARW